MVSNTLSLDSKLWLPIPTGFTNKVPSAAKNNADMDVFLMNDTTILRNISVTGHGGFMAVLDPKVLF